MIIIMCIAEDIHVWIVYAFHTMLYIKRVLDKFDKMDLQILFSLHE